jgi:hypothetical protein
MIYDNQRPVILKKMRTRPIKTKIVIEDPQDPHEQPQPEEEAE